MTHKNNLLIMQKRLFFHNIPFSRDLLYRMVLSIIDSAASSDRDFKERDAKIKTK